MAKQVDLLMCKLLNDKYGSEVRTTVRLPHQLKLRLDKFRDKYPVNFNQLMNALLDDFLTERETDRLANIPKAMPVPVHEPIPKRVKKAAMVKPAVSVRKRKIKL